MVIQTWLVYDAHTAKVKILTPILFNHGCMDGWMDLLGKLYGKVTFFQTLLWIYAGYK